MTTLITGATGFIGSAVARELAERGERIRCLVRKTSSVRNLDGLELELFCGDVLDMDAVRRAVQGCSRVYHLAAVYAIWLPNPSLMYRVNEQGTRNVLKACKEAGVQRVVYCSSVAALGAHGKVPADETAEFNLHATQDHYYISKHRAEQAALEFAGEGLPVVIVNPTVPIGPRDSAPTPSGALIIQIVKGKLPAYVDGGINVVDVTDCARAIVEAMEKGAVGGKYILGNRNVGIKEFFDLIVTVAGKGKSPSLRLPLGMAILSGHAYEILASFTGRPPLTSASWARVGSQFSWWDCSKARQELGLGQRPIEESIAEAVGWFDKNRYV